MINIIEIKDLDAPELQIYYNLNEAQLFHYFEPKPGIFIAESPKVIERALDAGCVPMSFLMEKKHVETQAKEILARCEKLQSRDLTQKSLVYREDEHVIPVYVAEVEVLAKITGYQLTRGMLCAMYRPALSSVEQLCKNARRVAILENVVNPTNVGAIFRSAAALGMDAVLLTPACADPLYRRANRVSMGTVFQIPWTYFDKNACWPDGAMAHEGQHVSNAYHKAATQNGEVVSASVRVQTSVCPECGRSYISGGVTDTQIRYYNESNPYQQDLKQTDGIKLRGANVDEIG